MIPSRLRDRVIGRSSKSVLSWSGPILVVVVALLLWSLSLQNVDLDMMSDVGLISVLPPLYFFALIILIAGTCWIIWRQQAPETVFLLYIVALIFVIHGTAPVLYGTLRYSWAWKHVGIVDYILRHHSVNPAIATLDAYHNWPGFFALSAFVAEAMGIDSVLRLAPWAEVFFNLLNLGALLLIMRTFSRDRRLVQLSILFFYIANWVGQDYYSPQALTYFLYLVVIGTCLNWFGVRKAPLSASDTRRRITDRVTALAGRFCPRDLKSDTALSESEPYQRVGLMAIIVVLSAAIVSGHQLTPLMLISATTMLVLFQQTKARGLPVVVLVLTLIWILFPAITFVDNHMEGILASIGRLTDNVHANLINLTVVSPGQRLVSLMGRGLSLLLWGVALLGGLRRLREGRWDMTGMLMAAAPIVVPMGNPYGGEILFRVFFFTLPFVAFFAAALVFPDQRAGKSWRAVATAFLLSIVLLVGFYYAHFGKERQYRFTQNEVDAAVYLYSNAPPNSLLIEGSRNYPTQFKNYEYFTYVPITREPMESRMRVIENPVETFGRWMDNPDYAATYLLITQSQKIESSVLGKLPSGSLDAVEQTLLRSGRFRVIYENKDARIFVLPDSAEGERE